MLGKTVFFVDIEDISDIKKEIKDDEKIIFPLNFKSEKILRKNKVETVIPDDFLEASDYQKIDDLSQELAKTWFENENLEKILNYKNINLGLMLERELGGTLLKFIHRIVLVEKILEKFQSSYKKLGEEYKKKMEDYNKLNL